MDTNSSRCRCHKASQSKAVGGHSLTVATVLTTNKKYARNGAKRFHKTPVDVTDRPITRHVTITSIIRLALSSF